MASSAGSFLCWGCGEFGQHCHGNQAEGSHSNHGDSPTGHRHNPSDHGDIPSDSGDIPSNHRHTPSNHGDTPSDHSVFPSNRSLVQRFSPHSSDLDLARRTVKLFSCGGSHTIIVTETDEVYSWGNGASGQLGTGSTAQHCRPQRITLPDLTAGDSWPQGSRPGTGQTDRHPPGPGTVQHLSGSVPELRDQDHGPPSKDTIAGVSCGGRHSFLWTAHGRTLSWGNNYYAQLGYDYTDERYKENQLTPRLVKPLAHHVVTMVACGDKHTAFLFNTGAMATMGHNADGQLGQNGREEVTVPRVLDDLPRIVSIACGARHCLAIDDDARVWQWGYGRACGSQNSDLLLPTKCPLRQRVVQVSGGQGHSMALTASGCVYTWGAGGDGQLGHGDRVRYRDNPRRVTSPEIAGRAARVRAGENYSAVITVSGRLYMFGKNSHVISASDPANTRFFWPREVHLGEVDRTNKRTDLIHGDDPDCMVRVEDGKAGCRTVRDVACGAWHMAAVTGVPAWDPGEDDHDEESDAGSDSGMSAESDFDLDFDPRTNFPMTRERTTLTLAEFYAPTPDVPRDSPALSDTDMDLSPRSARRQRKEAVLLSAKSRGSGPPRPTTRTPGASNPGIEVNTDPGLEVISQVNTDLIDGDTTTLGVSNVTIQVRTPRTELKGGPVEPTQSTKDKPQSPFTQAKDLKRSRLKHPGPKVEQLEHVDENIELGHNHSLPLSNNGHHPPPAATRVTKSLVSAPASTTTNLAPNKQVAPTTHLAPNSHLAPTTQRTLVPNKSLGFVDIDLTQRSYSTSSMYSKSALRAGGSGGIQAGGNAGGSKAGGNTGGSGGMRSLQNDSEILIRQHQPLRDVTQPPTHNKTAHIALRRSQKLKPGNPTSLGGRRIDSKTESRRPSQQRSLRTISLHHDDGNQGVSPATHPPRHVSIPGKLAPQTALGLASNDTKQPSPRQRAVYSSATSWKHDTDRGHHGNGKHGPSPLGSIQSSLSPVSANIPRHS